MNSSSVLDQLKSILPDVKFVSGDDFVWSSGTNTITHKKLSSKECIWALIHESAHAKLGHKNYSSDQHLLKMELEAWQEAKLIAKSMGIAIDSDHIEHCLDTYRDWLHNRATCPNCKVISGQTMGNVYKCFNCQVSWAVPKSPIKRTHKKLIKA